MNISPGMLSSDRQRRRQGKQKKFFSQLKLAALLIMTAIGLFIIVSNRVALNDRINRIERARHLESVKLKRLEREIANLEIKRAELCRKEYIVRKLHRYHLSFRLPYQGQVLALRQSHNFTAEPEHPVVMASASRKIQHFAWQR